MPKNARITLVTALTNDKRTVDVRPDATFVVEGVPADAVQITLSQPTLRLVLQSEKPAAVDAFRGTRRNPNGLVFPAVGDFPNLRIALERP